MSDNKTWVPGKWTADAVLGVTIPMLSRALWAHREAVILRAFVEEAERRAGKLPPDRPWPIAEAIQSILDEYSQLGITAQAVHPTATSNVAIQGNEVRGGNDLSP